MNTSTNYKACSKSSISMKVVFCSVVLVFLFLLSTVYAGTDESNNAMSREEELLKAVKQLQQTVEHLKSTQVLLTQEIISLKNEVKLIKSQLAGEEQQAADTTSTTAEDAQEDENSLYTIELKPVNTREYGVNWYVPFGITMLEQRPTGIKKWPNRKYDIQNYFTLQLGNADENTFNAMIDYRRPEGNRFAFTLYFDKDQDLDLAEDLISENANVSDIMVPYKDGTKEKYSVQIYSTYYHSDRGLASLAYQVKTGRYGILETDNGKFQIIIIDGDGNGMFNDSVDNFTIDLNYDRKVESSTESGERFPLYSPIKILNETFRVRQIDDAGKRIVLEKKA